MLIASQLYNNIIKNLSILLLLFNIDEIYSYGRHQTKLLSQIVDFSADDILNTDLLPAKIVTDQVGRLLNDVYTKPENVSAYMTEWTCINSTDLVTAIQFMRYHRRMINQYLLSGYLSKEIMGATQKTLNFSETMKKRSGKAKTDRNTDNYNANPITANAKLLEDEGSSQYLTWLNRMQTFNDIQKQLMDKKHQHNHNLVEKYPLNYPQSLSMNLNPAYGEADIDDQLDYLEDADITGYAYTNSPTELNVPISLHKTHHNRVMEGKSGNLNKHPIRKGGYEDVYDDYSASHNSAHNYDETVTTRQPREIGIKGITDVALTALAFLSFGMFVLQVLMCITMSKDDSSDMVVLPMEGTDVGDLPGGDNTEEIRRKRRSVPFIQLENIEMMDHLAKRALYSLNAATTRPPDGESCHRYYLCENNKFSKRLDNLKKLWIPTWSLGISWLMMQYHKFSKSSVLTNDNAGLSSLKAVAIGLSNGNCTMYYVNKCKRLF